MPFSTNAAAAALLILLAGGPALARLAEGGTPDRFPLPRPMLASGDLNFSFSGLKTAVLTLAATQPADLQTRADIAAAFQAAVVDVLASKSIRSLEETGVRTLVVAGGVGANRALRERLTHAARTQDFHVRYPPLELCTDNGAMIAHAGALRLQAGLAESASPGFTVRPRWDLEVSAAP